MDFDAALQNYLGIIQSELDVLRTIKGPKSRFGIVDVARECEKKNSHLYVRVVVSYYHPEDENHPEDEDEQNRTYIHSFVAMRPSVTKKHGQLRLGDILAAHSWLKPEPHAVGSIFQSAEAIKKMLGCTGFYNFHGPY